MQSIFGALLTAGYAAAAGAMIAASGKDVTSSTQAELTKSFSSAADTSPRSTRRTSRTRSSPAPRRSFLQGDQWAYLAGIIAVAARRGARLLHVPEARRREAAARLVRRGGHRHPAELGTGNAVRRALARVFTIGSAASALEARKLHAHRPGRSLDERARRRAARATARPLHAVSRSSGSCLWRCSLRSSAAASPATSCVGRVPAALYQPGLHRPRPRVGSVGYSLAYAAGQLFREGLFQFMTAFSLPWYAIVGAQKVIERSCRCSAAVRSRSSARRPNASSHRRGERASTPKQFIARANGSSSTAVLDRLGRGFSSTGPATTWSRDRIAFVVGFTFRAARLVRRARARAAPGSRGPRARRTLNGNRPLSRPA